MERSSFWTSPLGKSSIRTEDVRIPEMLIGYLIGPFGALLSSGIFTSILQNYFTDVLKLDLAFLSALQLVSTLFIVAANLAVGQLIERTKTPAGKAHPWILRSALLLSAASVLMFVVPFEGTARMVWIALAYNLYYAFAYPVYNTANATLVAVSTRDSKQRGTLASLSNMASLAVLGAGAMFFPILVSFALKEDRHLWFVAMLAVAVFTALTVFLQYRFTRERVTEEDMDTSREAEEGKEKAVPLAAQLRAVASEKWWWIAILFYLGYFWPGAMKNVSMAYFCKWVVDNSFFGSADAWGASQSLLSVFGAVPMMIAAALVVPLAKRFSKRSLCIAGLLLGVAGGVIAGLSRGKIVSVGIGIALKCLGSAPACYLILAMLADVIDHIEYKSGIRTDGLTMSVYSSLMVAATPVCNAVFSAVLKGAGYDQNIVVGRAVQSAHARAAITASYIWVETAGFAVCAVMLLLWTVEKVLPAEQEAIRARKAGEERGSDES